MFQICIQAQEYEIIEDYIKFHGVVVYKGEDDMYIFQAKDKVTLKHMLELFFYCGESDWELDAQIERVGMITLICENCKLEHNVDLYEYLDDNFKFLCKCGCTTIFKASLETVENRNENT